MNIKDHSILREFPDMGEQIHTLKKNDSHFAGMCERYDELEHHIHQVESGGETFTDEHIEELKKKRLKIKDELFSMLQKAA